MHHMTYTDCVHALNIAELGNTGKTQVTHPDNA